MEGVHPLIGDIFSQFFHVFISRAAASFCASCSTRSGITVHAVKDGVGAGGSRREAAGPASCCSPSSFSSHHHPVASLRHCQPLLFPKELMHMAHDLEKQQKRAIVYWQADYVHFFKLKTHFPTQPASLVFPSRTSGSSNLLRLPAEFDPL